MTEGTKKAPFRWIVGSVRRKGCHFYAPPHVPGGNLLTTMAGKRLIVTLTEDSLRKFPAAVKQVQQSGLKVKEKMPELGLIVGEVADAAAVKTSKAISDLPCVAAVEEEGSMEAI